MKLYKHKDPGDGLFTEEGIKFLRRAKRHPQTFQLSFPRSGRYWLRELIWHITKKPIPLLRYITTELYEPPPLYVVWHGPWFLMRHDFASLEEVKQYILPNCKYIVLFRDPRDSFLSFAYFQNKSYWKQGGEMKLELLEKQVTKENCDWWGSYFSLCSPHDTLFVQYEKLCLQPEIVLTEILEFLNVQAQRSISSVVEHWDNKVIKPEDNTYEGRYESIKYSSSSERYKSHCLKWTRSEFFLDSFNQFIWSELGSLMSQYGYTKDGHDLSLIMGYKETH